MYLITAEYSWILGMQLNMEVCNGIWENVVEYGGRVQQLNLEVMMMKYVECS